MKTIAVIPARLNSTRFPQKLLKPLGNSTVIGQTWKNTVQTNLFSEVIVATDSSKICDEINALGGKFILTSNKHQTGSDRIAEAVAGLSCDLIVNVQGDEPFTQKKPLEDLIEEFYLDSNLQVASLMSRFKNKEDVDNPNHVKVVTDVQGFALYFSRAKIPYNRDSIDNIAYFKHIGIYAYKKNTLLNFSQRTKSPLEQAENLEQLRYLENRIAIKMVETNADFIGIDTPEDLRKAENLIKHSI